MSQDTQIIGYAQPWIVSPGDPVDIKVGYFHPWSGFSQITGIPSVPCQKLTSFRSQVPKRDMITV
jgi:hypothetical protein